MKDRVNKPIEWISWKYGWGEDLSINRLFKLSAYKGTTRGEKFGFSFLNYQSKYDFETMESAKEAGLKFVKSAMEHGIRKLEDLEERTIEAINHKLEAK